MPGGGVEHASGINLYVLYFLDSAFVCAVNLFILISGYFMCLNNERILFKPFKLIMQVILYKEAFYFFSIILGMNNFSVRKVVSNTIPANYFVILYITIYFISPFLNILIEIINGKNVFDRFLAIIIVLFSLWPTIVDVFQEIAGKQLLGLSTVGAYGSQWGYSIVNFSVMYLIGTWIRKRKDSVDNKKSRHFLAIIISIGVLVIWACINDKIGYGVERSAWEYCNPVVIFIAVEYFLLFKQIRIENGKMIKIINSLAKGAFSVYLLHFHFLSHIGIEKFIAGNLLIMMFHIIASVIVIYFACWCVNEIYERVTYPIYNLLNKKFPVLSKNIVGI